MYKLSLSTLLLAGYGDQNIKGNTIRTYSDPNCCINGVLYFRAGTGCRSLFINEATLKPVHCSIIIDK